MSLKRNFILAVVTFTAISVAPSAYAKDMHIRYSKAELATPVGVERVYHRIHVAAEEVCDYQFGRPYAQKSRARFERCVRRTAKEIVGMVGHPKLDSLQAARPYLRKQERRDFAASQAVR